MLKSRIESMWLDVLIPILQIRICRGFHMKLHEICEIYSGYALKSFNNSNNGSPVIKIGNINSKGNLELEDCQFSEENVDEKYYSKNGDIYIALSGATTGKIGVMNDDEKYIINQRVGIIRRKNDSIPRDYIRYYLLKQTKKILLDASGCAQPNISPKQIADYDMPIISPKEMIEICNKLHSIEVILNNYKLIAQKLDNLIKARFVEMFGDPCKNDLEWKIAKLGNLTSKIGSGATPKGGKESYIGQGITFVRSMNVHDAHFVYKDLAHLNEEQANQLKNVEVKENDVFLNITGASVARACVVPSNILPARVNQHVCIIRCLPEFIDSIFLNYLFINNSYKNALIEIGESNGATRQAITKKQLEELEIIVPPLTLQNRFTDFVKQVDKSKFIQMNSTI